MAWAQFTDEWVENKTVFQLVSRSGCACCGMQVNTSLYDLYSQASDIDATDADRDDQQQKDPSPWPFAVRQKVWQDRIALRKKLKADAKALQPVLSAREADIVARWKGMDVDERRQACSLPMSELHSFIVKECKLDEAYQVVLLATVEQVQHFEKTLLPHDGVSDAELAFELALRVEDGCFAVTDAYLDLDDSLGFLTRLKQMGEQHLLDKPPRKQSDELKEDAAADSAPAPAKHVGRKTQSFRSDRRLVRLIIFRLIAAAFVADLQK